MTLEILILWCGVGGLVGWAIGNSKGRGTEGFWLGGFLGVIGWILVAFAKPSGAVAREQEAAAAVLAAQVEEVRANERNKPCPFCAELIKPTARVCRFCGREVEPIEVLSPESDLVGMKDVASKYPKLFDRAQRYFESLSGPRPKYPGAWLGEFCRRIEAGETAESAAAQIPLDWNAPLRR